VGDRAYAALDAHRWAGALAGRFAGVTEAPAPYVPGFFSFREGPPLLALIRAVRRRFRLEPDLLLVDGHGIAHPRRFGMACWLGVCTDLATVGCAKETLIRYHGDLSGARGSCLAIEERGETVGAALRTQDGVRPVFVSPGHKVSLRTAMDLILHLSPRYRLPEPLRRAHQSARASARGSGSKATTWLGELE
jgi:deoxyribonuclease V